MNVMNLGNFFVITTKNADYRVYINSINKKEAVHILNSSVLDDKGVL